MTATRGSGAPTATVEQPAYVRRFSRTERALHWLNAAGFFALLGTGAILYLPALSEAVGRRGFAKDLHVVIAIVWLAGLASVALAGDRGELRRAVAELEAFDDDDLRWLRGRGAPQGRFNAGQKVHAVLQAAFAVLFTVSGVLLLAGERDTDFRLSGTIVVHDTVTLVATVLVLGHLYLALVHRATRPALRGMLTGTVRRDWAARHHAKWEP